MNSMESPAHSVNSLFQQLGLPHSDEAIEQFINEHKPVPHDVLLHEAPFWTKSQATFLQQAIEDDADWAIVVDHLDTMLR